jgi:uncharacterized protein
MTAFAPQPADPMARPIQFCEVAQRLARINRFCGQPGALSVAQHAVMGAEAILAETGDAGLAALFLHHDDHEYVLGDVSPLVLSALEHLCPGATASFELLRANWDAALYQAAHLPPPDAWTSKQAETIALMDRRMRAAEMQMLFGTGAVWGLPRAELRTPKFTTNLSPPWPAEKAAERWLLQHKKLTGRTIR